MPLILAGLLRFAFGTVLHHSRLRVSVREGRELSVNVTSFSRVLGDICFIRIPHKQQHCWRHN